MSHSIAASWKSESEYGISISLCHSSKCESSEDCFERSLAAVASFRDLTALGSFDSKLFLLHQVLYLNLRQIKMRKLRNNYICSYRMISFNMATKHRGLCHNCLHGTFGSSMDHGLKVSYRYYKFHTCKSCRLFVAFHRPSLMDGRMHQYPLFCL